MKKHEKIISVAVGAICIALFVVSRVYGGWLYGYMVQSETQPPSTTLPPPSEQGASGETTEPTAITAIEVVTAATTETVTEESGPVKYLVVTEAVTATESNSLIDDEDGTTQGSFPTTGEETDSGWVSLGMFTLTKYCSCVKCCGIWSAEHPSRVGTDYVQRTQSGTIPVAGRTVGVNTEIIPFGTEIMIDSHIYTAEDTGAGAVGKRLIDIFCDTHGECVEFGKQTGEVWVRVE